MYIQELFVSLPGVFFCVYLQYVRECVNVYSQGALNPCNHGYQVVRPPMGPYLMTMRKEKKRERERQRGERKEVWQIVCRLSQPSNIILTGCLLCVTIPWNLVKALFNLQLKCCQCLGLILILHYIIDIQRDIAEPFSVYCFWLLVSSLHHLCLAPLDAPPLPWGHIHKAFRSHFILKGKASVFHVTPQPEDSLICIRKHLSKGSQKVQLKVWRGS